MGHGSRACPSFITILGPVRLRHVARHRRDQGGEPGAIQREPGAAGAARGSNRRRERRALRQARTRHSRRRSHGWTRQIRAGGPTVRADGPAVSSGWTNGSNGWTSSSKRVDQQFDAGGSTVRGAANLDRGQTDRRKASGGSGIGSWRSRNQAGGADRRDRGGQAPPCGDARSRRVRGSSSPATNERLGAIDEVVREDRALLQRRGKQNRRDRTRAGADRRPTPRIVAFAQSACRSTPTSPTFLDRRARGLGPAHGGGAAGRWSRRGSSAWRCRPRSRANVAPDHGRDAALRGFVTA